MNNRRVSSSHTDPSVVQNNSEFCTRVVLVDYIVSKDEGTPGNQRRKFHTEMKNIGWYPRIGTVAYFFWKRSDVANWRPEDEIRQAELSCQLNYPSFEVTFAILKPVNDDPNDFIGQTLVGLFDQQENADNQAPLVDTDVNTEEKPSTESPVDLQDEHDQPSIQEDLANTPNYEDHKLDK